MADTAVCPRCGEIIDPDDRCLASTGLGQCMERQGHDGYHWTDLGRGDGGVRIWTGLFSKHSCAGRLSLSDWCQKPPGHKGAHNNGRGMTFGEPHFEGCPALEGEEEDRCTCKGHGAVNATAKRRRQRALAKGRHDHQRKGRRMFDNWATPVTSKPWGVVTVATAWIKRHSGYRLFVHVHHWAWERSHGDKTRPHPWASV